MSQIKTIAVLTPNPVAKAPIMTPIPKPTLVNTQFTPVAKPTTQQTPPFQTISLIPTPIKTQKIEIINPDTKLPPLPPSPIKTGGKPTLTDFLPVVGLGIIALFILNRNQ
jgi:hypothetical protein